MSSCDSWSENEISSKISLVELLKLLECDINGCPYFLLQLNLFESELKNIRRAYKDLSLKCHPDKCGSDPGSKVEQQRLNAAKKFLEDDNLKRAYDNFASSCNLSKELSHEAWSQHSSCRPRWNWSWNVCGQSTWKTEK